MTDVAIIGIGIHPFGRTDDKTGLEQGAHAVREALGSRAVGRTCSSHLRRPRLPRATPMRWRTSSASPACSS